MIPAWLTVAELAMHGAVRDAKAYLATLTTPPADGSGEGA